METRTPCRVVDPVLAGLWSNFFALNQESSPASGFAAFESARSPRDNGPGRDDLGGLAT
jgi:hypothetical protein